MDSPIGSFTTHRSSDDNFGQDGPDFKVFTQVRLLNNLGGQFFGLQPNGELGSDDPVSGVAPVGHLGADFQHGPRSGPGCSVQRTVLKLGEEVLGQRIADAITDAVLKYRGIYALFLSNDDRKWYELPR